MEKEIAKLADHYIVCGIGRVGSNVAHELIKTKRSLVVVESDREALDRWLEQYPGTLHLHSTEHAHRCIAVTDNAVW